MKKNSFPTWVFPEELRIILESQAESIGCPVDYLACGLLLAASVICGNSHVLKIKEGFTVRAILYIALVGAPGCKKTPALRFALRVITEIQKRAKELYVSELKQFEKDLKAYNDGELDEKPIRPVKPMYIVTDATVEALIRQLKNNPRGLILFKDELSGFFHNMNRYSNGGDVDFYLELWDKDLVSCVRVSLKEEIEIIWPFTSIGGGIQPDVLRTISEMKDNGFRDRILWSYPTKPPKEFSFSDDAQGNVEAYCAYMMETFLNLEESQEIELVISDDAKPLFKKAFNELEAEANSKETPFFMKGSILKLTSYLGRIALILSILESKGSPKKELKKETIEKAYSIVKYFKSHCEDVYIEANSINLEKQQEVLLAWIKKQYEKKHGKISGGINVSWVLSAKVSGLKNSRAEDIKILFKGLKEAGYGDITNKRNGNNQLVPHFWLYKKHRM